MPEPARTTRAAAPAPTPNRPATAPSPAAPATRAPAGPPAVRLGGGPAVSGGGEPLPAATQTAIERSLRVDLSGVRVHGDSSSANAAANLGARAFTYGSHIFLGRGAQASDLGLMAHEATHVVQQRGAPAVQLSAPGQGDTFEREAQRAAAAVQHGEPFDVREQVSSPRVQRAEQGFWSKVGGAITDVAKGAIDLAKKLGIDKALNFIADKANIIPGFRMFTIVLGVNPINMSKVDRNAANILRALLEILPLGGLISQALNNSGVFDKVGAWVEKQINTLGMIGSSIKQALMDFLNGFEVSDLGNLGGLWERAKKIFTDPIDRIKTFATGLVSDIIQFVKDAILRPLAKLAEGTRGYDLLKALLGKDPVTGDPVPFNADTVVGGLMKLANQQEVWENVQKAKAGPRVVTWFQKAKTALIGFVQQIPTLAVNAFKSLKLEDILLVKSAFDKVWAVFGDFVGKFVSWAGDAVWSLLEIIFEALAPKAIPYLKKVGAAFKTILKNPIGFVGNLVKAGKLGFQQFADNIGAHLKASLLEWLTGSLPGIYIPKSFEFLQIVKFVLSVLGLTWQNIRQKLVKVVTEPVVKAMETGFDIVVKLVTEGPAAAWEEIKKQIGNLKDMAIQAIVDFVVDTVVKKAVAKVVSMLVPGGAFIQAIITIYDTIMVFIDKLQKIIQVALAFIDSIVAITNGDIGGAANRVEKTLAGLLTLAISFLAGFASLGKIADKVMDIINKKIRTPIEQALNKVVDWIVTMAKKLFATGKAAVQKTAAAIKNFLFPKLPFKVGEKSHTLTVDAQQPKPELVVESSPQPVAQYLYRLKPQIDAIPTKNERAKAQTLYQKALDQRKKAADTLEMVFDPKSGKTKTEQAIYKETKILLDYIQEIWKLLGASDDLLPKETDIDTYASLGTDPEMTAHHVPQNAILNRLRQWLELYLGRPTIEGFREHMSQRLAGLGVKFSNLQGYGQSKGVSIRMQKIKHNRTRTFGKLPQDLDIPQGDWKVKGKHAGDERIERFVKIARQELKQDIEDVGAIYSGKKGPKKVPSYQKVAAALAKLVKENIDAWGSFLR